MNALFENIKPKDKYIYTVSANNFRRKVLRQIYLDGDDSHEVGISVQLAENCYCIELHFKLITRNCKFIYF